MPFVKQVTPNIMYRGELWYLKLVINLWYLFETTICVSVETTERKIMKRNKIEKINERI